MLYAPSHWHIGEYSGQLLGHFVTNIVDHAPDAVI